MQWLIDRLGFDRMLAVDVITPSDTHFPEAYSGSDEEIERVFGLVCRQIGVARESVELAIFDGARPSLYLYDGRNSALGVYEQRTAASERHTVWIERSQTVDPLHLISTAAHELAHCILLGDGLLLDSDADHEFITDLLPVVRGLGIFAANSAIYEETHLFPEGGSWRSVSKAGYLPSRMFGYALAVFAWLRSEKPTWARYLRGDPQHVFKAGLAYLNKSNDCLCRSPTQFACDIPKNLSARLVSERPGVRLSALWELRRPDPPNLTADDWTAVVAGLDDRDAVFVSEAALAITAVDHHDVRVVERGMDLLERYDDNPHVLSAAALALGTQQAVLAADSELMQTAVDLLLKRLDHPSQRVIIATLTALKRIAPACDFFLLRQLMQVFRTGLLACDNLLVIHAVETLRAVCESPHKELASHFPEDAELRSHASAALASEIDEAELINVRLPTSTSLPVPLPDWRPTPLRLSDEPESAPESQDTAP
jgi:hypothetical protein